MPDFGETTGRVNQYLCGVCGGTITTVNRADGVTPFMLACRAREGCSGMMASRFYHVQGAPEPTHEWYRPDEIESRFLGAETAEHVADGGLLIRPVSRG